MLRPDIVGMQGSVAIRPRPCMRSSTSLLSSTPSPPLPAFIPRLESAGIRAIPVRYDATPEELKPLMDGVNGLFFPGGGPPIPDGARLVLGIGGGGAGGGVAY